MQGDISALCEIGEWREAIIEYKPGKEVYRQRQKGVRFYLPIFAITALPKGVKIMQNHHIF